MKILVFGGSGMLGHKLVQKLSDKFDVWTTIRNSLQVYEKFNLFDKERIIDNLNVEEFHSVKKVVSNIKPQVIINAVGVIKQIPTSKNVVKTLWINSIFPHQLAETALENQARLITISTDCVFNGEKGNYSELDLPDAFDIYGKSKHLGEILAENCLTLRTSIIGRELTTEHSLVEWFLSNRGSRVKGYSEAIYTGFPTVILAEILADLIDMYPDLNGLYHVSSNPINKFNLLQLINEAYNAKIEIERFEEFKIDRSLDSSRFREATGFEPLDWTRMIEIMANDNALYQNK